VETVFPTREPWKVSEFRLDEIRTLDAGSWFVREDPFDQIAQGNVSAAEASSFIGERVPTLREALEFVAANDWLMDIEVKAPLNTDFETAAAELQALVVETDTQDRVMVSSFDIDLLRAVQHVAPELPIGVLTILPPLGAIEWLQSLGADVYLPSMVGFTDALLADLEEAGIRVIVWTYDSEDQLEFAAGLLGVDGIYTDFPQRLTALLAEQEP
jgi:glycerophosphoryl diester phosphodiesterase